jgi:hypothetical protein
MSSLACTLPNQPAPEATPQPVKDAQVSNKTSKNKGLFVDRRYLNKNNKVNHELDKFGKNGTSFMFFSIEQTLNIIMKKKL